MRLWSLHPSYLDRAGLTACWREGLLARKVLEGNTVGYRNHPQLARFRNCSDPVGALDAYLHAVCSEAERRGYSFDRSKLGAPALGTSIAVTAGQVEYEKAHLKTKLLKRDPSRCEVLAGNIALHPVFILVEGDIEPWEVIK